MCSRSWCQSLTGRTRAHGGRAIEFWSASTGSGFQNVVYERNLNLSSGYGFGGTFRPDQWARVHLLTYGWTTPADVKVRNNIFWDAYAAYRKSDDAAGSAGMSCSGNLIALRAGTPMMYGKPHTIEAAREWARSIGNDTASDFRVIAGIASESPSDAEVAAARALVGSTFYGGALANVGGTVRRAPLTAVTPAA